MLLSFIAQSNAGYFIHSNKSHHTGKTQSIKGKIEYGCGGSNGTYCYIVTNAKNQSYIIDYGYNIEIQRIDFLNQLIEFQSCVVVKGMLSNQKVGVFKKFNPNKAIEISSCQ